MARFLVLRRNEGYQLMAGQVRIRGIQETVNKLRRLPGQLSGKNGGPIRKALFQAAKVVELEAVELAKRIDDPETDTRIFEAVKKWRERNPRQFEGSPTEMYHVGVDGRKAPHWHFLELGTVKQPAQPYLRPAAEGKFGEAVDRFGEVLKKDVERLEKTTP